MRVQTRPKQTDAKPLHYDKEIDSHVLRTSDTVWHIIINQMTLNTSQNSECKKYALFTDTEFQCDETPSVSCNREVVPLTERNDSTCCRPAFPLDRNA